MKRIVLPGSGTPTTFTVAEDSTIGVLADGKLVTVALKANVPTRIVFVNSISAPRFNSGIAA